jgi:hypothetical protein
MINLIPGVQVDVAELVGDNVLRFRRRAQCRVEDRVGTDIDDVVPLVWGELEPE